MADHKTGTDHGINMAEPCGNSPDGSPVQEKLSEDEVQEEDLEAQRDSRSKFRITMIMLALYVCVFSMIMFLERLT